MLQLPEIIQETMTNIPATPASYESENVISVGANNHKGKSAYFSCYGKTSVDLFAPGVNTLSTTPGNQYASFSGTSMATPHVAGAYALVLSVNPSWNAIQVKDALMESVDVEDSLSEKCVTSGRLNVFHALSSETPDENLIAVKPTEIDFGQVSVNQLHEMEFILSNPGSAPTTLTELYIEGTKEDTNDLIDTGHSTETLDATEMDMMAGFQCYSDDRSFWSPIKLTPLMGMETLLRSHIATRSTQCQYRLAFGITQQTTVSIVKQEL